MCPERSVSSVVSTPPAAAGQVLLLGDDKSDADMAGSACLLDAGSQRILVKLRSIAQDVVRKSRTNSRKQ